MGRFKGLFITFEGIDGCGKSTQSKLLVSYLKKSGYSIVSTREPGGVDLAESLRKLVLAPGAKIVPLAELLIYEAGRAELVQELIRPALKNGKIVICDRFADASLAYQGYGRGLNLKLVRKLNELATGGLKPDLTFLLYIPVRKRKNKKRDRLERESFKFHRNVSRGYQELAAKEPKRFIVVNVQKKINQTQRIIRQHLRGILKDEF